MCQGGLAGGQCEDRDVALCGVIGEGEAGPLTRIDSIRLIIQDFSKDVPVGMVIEPQRSGVV